MLGGLILFVRCCGAHHKQCLTFRELAQGPDFLSDDQWKRKLLGGGYWEGDDGVLSVVLLCSYCYGAPWLMSN